MSQSILNWERLVLKGVRSRDYEDMGNIIAIDKENITIMMGRHEFKIPKDCVEGYNGSEVFLNIPSTKIYKYKIF